ncbi:MAG: carboxypeptidase-like regulatory domain-containing protein, partial [Flavobacteriaceae bacterium]|nr:carboxypeptidase-like regulatory domain-containing protein [Flavobacteriaceae bacterium]
MRINPLLMFFLLLWSTTLMSQVMGKVEDANGTALPFVNIYIEGTYLGTTSNDDGKYELNLNIKGDYIIVFKFLGFKTLKRNITIKEFPYSLDAVMTEEKISLEEVKINAKDNPANRIIRQTIANRKRNLEKIRAFKADFYSKGLIRIKNAHEKILGQDIGDLGGGLDSTRTGILYLSETLSKIHFERPDKLKEEIVASKVAGNDSGFSFNNATDVDFNFYNNTIEIESDMVSPISDFAFNYYRYELDGIFYDDFGNLINKVKVIPKRENDRVFSGMIYIVEDQWSLYALELNTTGQQSQIEAVDTILLKQNFKYSQNDAHWVLLSQSIDFAYGIFGIKGDGRFTAVFSNYEFNPKFEAKEFSRELLSFTEEANKKDSTFWNTIRPVPLTSEEFVDYSKKDSIQIVRKSKKYLDSIDAKSNRFNPTNLLFGYNYQNSYKDWNLGFSSLLSSIGFNTVQGFTGNLDVFYRKDYDEFRRYLGLRTSMDYGFEDQRLRISGSATFKFNNVSRPFLTLSGGVRTEQFNESQPISPFINTISTLFFEDNYMKLYDRYFLELSYSHEWFNGFRWFSTISYE